MTPGTWAWACEQMLEGKTVERTLCGRPYRMRIIEDFIEEKHAGDYEWECGFCLSSVDLTATDWRVVEVSDEEN